MANKNYYYVLVFTNNGPVYVTGLDNLTKTAFWNKEEKPLELGMYKSEDLVFGLNCNFTNAIVVKSKFKIESQPYNYNDFECEFIRKEGK